MVCGPVLLSFLVFVLLTAFFFLLSSAILMPNGKFCAGLFSFYLWYKKRKWVGEESKRYKGRLMRRAWLQSEDSDLLSDKMKISRISASSLSIYGCMVACVCFAVCVCGGGVTSCKQAAKVCVYPTCFYLVCSSETSTDVLCLWAQSPSSNTFNNNFEPKKSLLNICVKVKNSAHGVPTNTHVQAVQTYIHKARCVCTNNFLHTSRWKHPDKQYYIILRQFMWTLCTHLYRHLIIK